MRRDTEARLEGANDKIAALFVETDGLRERFFAKTAHNAGTGCLEWTASKNGKGYGTFAIATSRPALAHRVAWALATGAWPKDCLLHVCDNPACVEVRHLKEGSRADNNADMERKGRARKTPSQGERNGLAKLTSEAVLTIRTSSASGPSLAEQFGISRSLVSQVRKRLVWGHL
jgi:hypothetical protein